MHPFYLVVPLFFLLLSYGSDLTPDTDCQTATVGQPFSTCFDIWTNAGLTEAQFDSFNPGIDCSTLQLGQKVCISAGTLPSNTPKPQPNGTCAEYTTVPGDSCSAIAVKFDITVAEIEQFNANTFKWTGCNSLQANFTMCVSTGTPPPIPIIPGLQCGPQSEGNATCPLNVCCSAFGFCGLTDEFCTTTGPNPCISNCFTPTIPSCSTSRTMRKIGYYAGWGNRRACGTNVSPDEIDWTSFTGAHFAFATISQQLAIQLDDADVPLLQSLVDQKSQNPNLQVVIAVGGWDFSEDDPTRDLFSFMIASTDSRATFISSVESFLTQYELDGIDIDFEYPSAIERNAPPTDTPNLTAFFQELRTALGNKIISCATPAGFWFLQGFEIDKIAKSVTYLNMMSYDYHGPWDTNVTDQAPVTNPHTSILDMQDSAKLYLRAGIDLSVVNLGLAYYARTYQLVDASCKGYNCTMNGGGAAGPCTTTPGILAQFEVEDLLDSGLSATLDSPTETFWFDNQGSLVTFDKDDTWTAKTTFAESSCFGGTFIWSLDQKIDNLIGGGSGSGSGAGGSGIFSTVIWNPNPFPSSGAASETFIQKPGTVLSTFITTIGTPKTSTLTTTFTIPAFTSKTTDFTTVSGTIRTSTGTTVIPATTSTLTFTATIGSTVTSTTLVTKTATTVVIPVPRVSTTVAIQGVTITLNSGGTPVNSPVPTFITQPNAVTPTWTLNILPPPSATVVTFTAPLTSTPTYSSTVSIPPKSSSSGVIVVGPPGDHSRCSLTTNLWTLLFGGIINGCLPADVGIRGGITPTPIPPTGWIGAWTDPFPLPTEGPPPGNEPSNSQTSTTTSTSTSTSSTSCPTVRATYNLSDDPENVDADTLGTDPDQRRKREEHLAHVPDNLKLQPNASEHTVHRRASPRTAAIPDCGLTLTSSSVVSLGAGTYYLVPFYQNGRTGTTLESILVGGRPSGLNFLPANQEHVFEIGYINQFFTDLAVATGCDWIERDIIDYTRIQGKNPSNLGTALIDSIDNVSNMVWVDKPMNQAKSNVVNNNRQNPQFPPQYEKMVRLTNFAADATNITDLETFARNFAALGRYFDQTSRIFSDTSLNFMMLLSEVTPSIIPDVSHSLPVIFRDWLSEILSEYPAGCTSRAINVWNAYRSTLTRIAAATTNNQVPNCFPLFTVNYQPSSFDFRDLLPPAPTLPGCNVPGTQGTIGYTNGNTTVRSLPFDDTPQRIMGSGNLNYYAVGSGSSLTDFHYQAIDASQEGPACNGVVAMLNRGVGSGLDANIDLHCNGATGPQEADFTFVVNGQSLGCAGVTTGNAGGDLTNILCAASQGAALDCIRSALPNNSPFTVQMRWFPS